MRRLVIGVLPIGALALLGACTGLIGVKDIYTDADGSPVVGTGTDAGPRGDAEPFAPETDAQVETGPTCTADTSSDPKHCGFCGHDCLGGDCSKGACQPVLVAPKRGQPYAIAVDSTSIYYSDVSAEPGVVYKADKLAVGAVPKQIATTTDPLIYDLKVDTSGVYFASGSVSYSSGKGLVEACALDGTNKRTVAMAAVPRGLAIDGTSVYWAAVEGTPVPVQKAAKMGAVMPPVTLAPSEDGTETVHVDGVRLYWAKDTSTGGIRRCTLPQCLDTMDFVPSAQYTAALATNSTLLFYASAGVIMSIPKGATGCPCATVAGSQPQPVSIVADDNDLYWVNTGTNDVSFANGEVRHCPIVAGKPQCVANGEVIATATQNPRVIAMDAKAIYWTVQYEGAVYRLAR